MVRETYGEDLESVTIELAVIPHGTDFPPGVESEESWDYVGEYRLKGIVSPVSVKPGPHDPVNELSQQLPGRGGNSDSANLSVEQFKALLAVFSEVSDEHFGGAYSYNDRREPDVTVEPILENEYGTFETNRIWFASAERPDRTQPFGYAAEYYATYVFYMSESGEDFEFVACDDYDDFYPPLMTDE